MPRIFWLWTTAPGQFAIKSASGRIFYVSADSNLFVEQVLRSLPGVQTFRGSADNKQLPGDPFDLYVFNGWLPNRLPGWRYADYQSPRQHAVIRGWPAD